MPAERENWGHGDNLAFFRTASKYFFMQSGPSGGPGLLQRSVTEYFRRIDRRESSGMARIVRPFAVTSVAMKSEL